MKTKCQLEQELAAGTRIKTELQARQDAYEKEKTDKEEEIRDLQERTLLAQRELVALTTRSKAYRKKTVENDPLYRSDEQLKRISTDLEEIHGLVEAVKALLPLTADSCGGNKHDNGDGGGDGDGDGDSDRSNNSNFIDMSWLLARYQ